MKTGLVVEGGGMKCAYSAGLIDGLLDDGITFDECIGVSAGAANAARVISFESAGLFMEKPPSCAGQFCRYGNRNVMRCSSTGNGLHSLVCYNTPVSD